MKGFNNECTQVMERAYELAKQSGGLVGTEHIVCGMLACPDSNGGKLLAEYGLSKSNITNIINCGSEVDSVNLSDRAKNAIYNAGQFALKSGSKEISSDKLLLAILIEDGSYASRALRGLGVDIDSL
ncbi:MAG: Clp protease N-terminal domain-containing protein, partial [Clostridia bacterium]